MGEPSGESGGFLSFLGRPPGDPSQLHRGAQAWERLGDEIDGSFRVLQRAVEVAIASAAWEGRAARDFLEVWESLAAAGRDGRRHLHDFAGQLSHVAVTIEEAQDRWERAVAAAAAVTGISVGLTFFTFGASNAIAAAAAARSAATIAAVAAWLDCLLAGAGAVFTAFVTTAISLAARFTVNFAVNLVAQGAAGAIQRPDHSPFHLDLSDAAAYAGLDAATGRLVPAILPRSAPAWTVEGATGAVSDITIQWAGPGGLNWFQVGLSGGLGAGAGGLRQRAARRFHLADGSLMEATAARTSRGEVNPRVLEELMERLPAVSLTGDPTERKLRSYVAATLGTVPEKVTIARIEGGGAKGASGAPVSVVSDDAGKAVAILKVFPKPAQFAEELSALERLNGERFELMRIVTPLGVGKATAPEGESGILVMSVASGMGLDDLIAKAGRAAPAQRAEALAELERAVGAAAGALAELHTRPRGSGDPVSRYFVERHVHQIDDIVHRLRPMAAALGGQELDLARLGQRVSELIDDFRAHPGGAALVHGDAHAGNVFYGPNAGPTLIDTPNLHKSMDEGGHPIGVPAHDFAYLHQNLASFGRQSGLREGESARMQEVFRRSYQEAGGAPMTKESLAFFHARSALGDLVQSARRATPYLEPLIEGKGATSSGRSKIAVFKEHARLAKEALSL